MSGPGENLPVSEADKPKEKTNVSSTPDQTRESLTQETHEALGGLSEAIRTAFMLVASELLGPLMDKLGIKDTFPEDTTALEQELDSSTSSISESSGDVQPPVQSSSLMETVRQKVLKVIKGPKEVINTITKWAQNYKIPASLAIACASAESAFNINAKSSAGALGVLQVMPATAKDIARDLGISLPSSPDAIRKLFSENPELNIQFGLFYLRQRKDRIQGLYGKYLSPEEQWNFALAEYNTGPGNLDRDIREYQKANNGEFPRSFKALQRYLHPETQAYVPTIRRKEGNIYSA